MPGRFPTVDVRQLSANEVNFRKIEEPAWQLIVISCKKTTGDRLFIPLNSLFAIANCSRIAISNFLADDTLYISYGLNKIMQ